MSKTKPVYKDTKLWTLSIQVIENIIFDNVILVKAYIFENYKKLDFNIDILLLLHKLLCENLFEQAGNYRKHNVHMWTFEPMDYYELPIEMKKLDDDIKFRFNKLKSEKEKKDFLAYVMRRILWIHPFFDYNWRVTRLFWELFMLKTWLELSTFQWATRKDFVNAMKKATSDWSFDYIVELL